ncbi:hypothetical protein BDW69DRAFT_185327 [Aspergillus filifer]
MTGTTPDPDPNTAPQPAQRLRTIALPDRQQLPPHLYQHVHPDNLRRHLQMQQEGSSSPTAIIRGNIVYAQFSTRTPSTSTSRSSSEGTSRGNGTPPDYSPAFFGVREAHINDGESRTGVGGEAGNHPGDSETTDGVMVDDGQDTTDYDVDGDTQSAVIQGNGYNGDAGGMSAYYDLECLRREDNTIYWRQWRRRQLAQRAQRVQEILEARERQEDRNLGYGQDYTGRARLHGYESPDAYHQQHLPTPPSIISPQAPHSTAGATSQVQREQSPSPSPPTPYPSLSLPTPTAPATVHPPTPSPYESLTLALGTHALGFILIGALSLVVSTALLVGWYEGWIVTGSLVPLTILGIAMVAYWVGVSRFLGRLGAALLGGEG